MEQLKSARDAVLAALPDGIPAWVWVAAMGGLVLFRLYVRVFSARIAWRIILRFFLIIILPLALIPGAVPYGLSQVTSLDAGGWQGIIGASVLAAVLITARVDMLRAGAVNARSLHRMMC